MVQFCVVKEKFSLENTYNKGFQREKLVLEKKIMDG